MWRHISSHRVITRPFIETCLWYIRWTCTILGSQKVYKIRRASLQI